MELTAQLVVSARRRARLSARDLAVLAGVSPSLVSRTESGKTVPSADAFRDLLRAAGFTDAGGTLAPLSRPSALWAARWLLGDLDTKPVDADEWVALWARIGLASASASTPAEPVAVAALLFRAGRCAVLPARPGSVPVATSMLGGQIADRLSAARIDYAFTGDEALSRLGSTIIPSWPVAYVASVRDAVAALGVRPILPGERGPRALLVPFDGTSEQGRVQVAGQSFVSPVQAVLDCFGGDGRMVEQAQQVVEAWEEQR